MRLRLFGFSVESDEGLRVAVDLEPWTFVVEDPSGGLERVGLPLGRGLATDVAAAFGRRKRRKRTRVRVEPPSLPEDVVEEITRARDRAISLVPDEVCRVHAAVFLETNNTKGVHGSPAFYGRHYLVKDVLTARAAAIAVGHADELAPDTRGDVFATLDRLERWPGLFSPTGGAYRSLRRTLANLPYGISSNSVCRLRHVELVRPVTTPMQFRAITSSLDLVGRPGTGQLRQILLHATDPEITAAVPRVGDATGEPLRPASIMDLSTTLGYLADYPGEHHGRLGGLVTKAIGWHEEWKRRSVEEVLEKAGGSLLVSMVAQPTKRPPWPLDGLPAGVRFLDTVEAVGRESADMNHCVATFAPAAVRGGCFFFHVEHEGAEATVELSPDGECVQAAGPANTNNRAVAWGRRVLEGWWLENLRARAAAAAARARSGSRSRSPRGDAAAGADWERAVARIRERTGVDPEWLAELERFRERVVEEERGSTPPTIGGVD